jgi:ribose 1,5-bisphosphate isomerase
MGSPLEDVLSSIRTNTRDGAAHLARRALDALALTAGLLPPDPAAARGAIIELVSRIHTLRPAMGAVGAQALLALARAEVLQRDKHMSWADALTRATRIEIQGLEGADAHIAAQAVEAIGRSKRIVTCSSSSTVQSALLALHPERVIIGGGHPLGDGRREAERLAALGLAVELLPDGALPRAVGEADAVVIGADQVLRDGAVVNRASSFSLGLAARFFGAPFVVVCQRIKLAGQLPDRISPESCPDETAAPPAGVERRAPLFEIVPGELIGSILTERGVLAPREVAALGEEMAALRRTFGIPEGA